MTTVMTSLDEIVAKYLHDTPYFQKREQISSQRLADLAYYQRSTQKFIDGLSNLDTLRNELKTLHQQTYWGGHTMGFLMELNKLANNHVPYSPDIEANFRTLLRGLNAQNVGQRIEQCYALFSAERERLKTVLTDKKIVSPGNSAMIISLFACWLDYPSEPYVCYPSLRTALRALFIAKLLLTPANINLNRPLEIKSASDYQSIATTLNVLAANQPQLKQGSYWVERFTRWIVERLEEDPTFLQGMVILVDENKDDLPSEDGGTPDSPVHAGAFIDNLPLQAKTEPLLSRLIAEVRKHILVEEKVVRNIYYALLGGHLILTGPPGTGKTELARLIPEILWQCEVAVGENGSSETTHKLSAHTAYTTTLVTATAEWSTRTLISSIMPVIQGEKIAYQTQHGHLVQAILCNWGIDPHRPEQWEQAQRVCVEKKGALNGHAEEAQPQQFQGHWLIIDEFNRAPIEIALGEAMTALSNGDALQITLNGQAVKLPIPKDFRIIGTLNSFDRHHVQTIGEALKRRFSFVEILPPSRAQSDAEAAMVLYKALRDVAHLDQDRIKVSQGQVYWEGMVLFSVNEESIYQDTWDESDGSFLMLFYEMLWPLFEVLRVYRQLGTAQAIALTRQVLMRGILEKYTDHAQWRAALDTALTTVIADQLQVILSDELGILLWRLRLNKQDFLARYYQFLDEISVQPKRFARHLEALQRIVHTTGEQLLSDETIEHLLDEEEETAQLIHELLTTNLLSEAFHLDAPLTGLPQFTRRLRTFKAEHGL